ncbi:MAG: AzlC family ABC transporter permease [Clostridia bacterium]|nr:AzlC family ABC transporter permease [Clostridia bacterium]
MENYNRGRTAGIPIALGYLSGSFTFGIMAVSYGLSWWQAVLISMTTVTSAGQFAGIGIITAGGSFFELALSQFVINLRYSLMGISLSQKLDKSFTAPKRAVLGHALTDEIFGVSVSRTKPVTPLYFLGLATLPYIGWSLGTALGAVFGELLNPTLRDALSVAIYGMFIAIIVPEAKNSLKTAFIILLAVAISCVICYVPVFGFISDGFSIIICAVTASVIGALLFPVKEDTDDGC